MWDCELMKYASGLPGLLVVYRNESRAEHTVEIAMISFTLDNIKILADLKKKRKGRKEGRKGG